MAPPNLNPGQFQTFTTTSPTVTPTNPLNAFPAGPFTAAARANVTYTTVRLCTCVDVPQLLLPATATAYCYSPRTRTLPSPTPLSPSSSRPPIHSFPLQSSGSTATVPASVDPSQGLFFALHLDVGQACPAPY